MLVKHIALSAAKLLQADDMESLLNGNDQSAYSDPDVKTMIKCVNLAAAELGGEFPVLRTQTFKSNGRTIPLTSFIGEPITVSRVEFNGVPVTFTFDNRGIGVPTDGEFTVVYSVATPENGPLDSVVIGAGVDSYMLVYLTARNYCLITGRTDEASIWDQRYNAEAEKKRIARRVRLPGRHWR